MWICSDALTGGICYDWRNDQITDLVEYVRSNAPRQLRKQHQVVRATAGHGQPLFKGAQLPRQNAQLAW